MTARIIFSHGNSFPASTYRVMLDDLRQRGFRLAEDGLRQPEARQQAPRSSISRSSIRRRSSYRQQLQQQRYHSLRSPAWSSLYRRRWRAR